MIDTNHKVHRNSLSTTFSGSFLCVRATDLVLTMKSSTHARYDMRLNPVYQIDFKAGASGKRFAATKRRVKFSFGFSNAEALAEGLTGAECRGDEHEVCLVWSLASGKRLVTADGIDVHFSVGRITDGLFETSWTIRGGHMIKLIAHAAPPVFVTPGFRQFDLLLDGCSFFDMPRIYELGIKSNSSALVPAPMTGYSNYSVSPTKRQLEARPSYDEPGPGPERQFAQRPSAAVSPISVLARDYLDESPAASKDLLDSDAGLMSVEQFVSMEVTTRGSPAVPSKSSVTNASYTQESLSALPTFYTHHQPSPTTQQQQQQQQHGFQSTPPQHHHQQQHGFQSPNRQLSYTPPHSMNSQPQTYLQLQYYQASPVQQATDYHHHAPVPVTPENHSTPVAPSSFGKLTMQPLNLQEMEFEEEPNLPDMERALKTLVNLQDITETLETPEQLKLKERRRMREPCKSKPRPPATPEWHLGSNPPIGDTQKYAQPRAPTKEIMRSHIFDPAAAKAGMMVVYGASIPASPGFGVGVQSGYYGHPQAQMYPAY